MPYREIFVPAEAALEHNGVVVYHTYKDDDFDQGVWDFWYGLTPDCLVREENSFDVRDVAAALSMAAPRSEAQIKQVLIKAIDLALAGQADRCGVDFALCWRQRNAYRNDD